jgi:COMPASS component BRE2
MATDAATPRRDATPDLPNPATAPTTSSLPQKRALDDDHVPMVSSPLNPNPDPRPIKTQDDVPPAVASREKRTKKESLKKRESKGVTIDSTRATPEPKRSKARLLPSDATPLRYKLAPPKPGDFEPARGPVFTHHHDVPALDGSTIAFHETSEQ